MKYLLSLFLVFLTLFCNPADGAKSEKPFIAVFINPGAQLWWDKYKPDLIFTASSWDDFPLFCKMVKQAAKGRQDVYIDIDCHGSDIDGMLYLQYAAFQQLYSYKASIGYVLNELAAAKIKPTKMLLEACYSEIVMESGIRNTDFAQTSLIPGDQVEDCKLKEIKYPIYGIGKTVNISNLIYLQDKYNVHASFQDMRPYINKPVAKPDKDSRIEYKLRALFTFLYTYGT